MNILDILSTIGRITTIELMSMNNHTELTTTHLQNQPDSNKNVAVVTCMSYELEPFGIKVVIV
jgi:hypothetical protein